MKIEAARVRIDNEREHVPAALRTPPDAATTTGHVPTKQDWKDAASYVAGYRHAFGGLLTPEATEPRGLPVEQAAR